ATAIGASESTGAPGASESAAALGARASTTTDSSLAPLPRSPLAAVSPQHALPSPCLWPSQVLALPSLPHSPAPPCLPCVEGRQRATPHSSEFPPTNAPLHTLHMDVWGPAPVSGTDQERYFLLVVDDYTRYTTVFPLRRKDLPVLRLHSDRGGEASSGLLEELCRDEGIRQTFTLPASPQHNGIAERRIGLIMEVAVRYAAHQLNLWPRLSEPETSPTLRWTGKVGDASLFRVGWKELCRDEGIRQTFTLPASPQHNGIAERRIGLIMEVAVRYAAHQLNLWPRLSEPETSPTLRWTGKVGDASLFRVWGAC
ncbi:unnamed protein product, partial [Closterium sp. NIES-53]